MRPFPMLIALLALPLWTASAPFASDEHSGKKDEAESALPRIDMEPFNFSLLDNGRVRGKVTLRLTLVVNDSGHMEFVRLHLPQVRSDFLSALTVLARQRFSVQRPIDPDVVTAFLTPYADARLGPGRVTVYVKEALIAPK